MKISKREGWIIAGLVGIGLWAAIVYGVTKLWPYIPTGEGYRGGC